jgi:hypothetical protein
MALKLSIFKIGVRSLAIKVIRKRQPFFGHRAIHNLLMPHFSYLGDHVVIAEGIQPYGHPPR